MPIRHVKGSRHKDPRVSALADSIPKLIAGDTREWDSMLDGLMAEKGLTRERQPGQRGVQQPRRGRRRQPT